MSKILISLITCFSILFLQQKSATARSVREIGDALRVIIPAYAFGLSMNEEGYDGAKQFGASILSSQITVEALKKITHKKRPDYKEGDKMDSFPSGHAAAAFSGATFIHKRYGLKRAILPYLGATFVAYSRVESDRHHVSDVVGGAVVASLYTLLFVDKAPNTTLYADSNGVGINYNLKF